MPTSPSASLPPIIYGTAWKKERTAELVEQALLTGFRGIDTACQPKHYNESGVGDGLRSFLGRGTTTRDALYVQTKFTSVDGQDPKRIPYDSSAALSDQVIESCAVSRANLGVDVLDCLVLHSPMRTLDATLTVWRAFEELVERGWVRRLGISNCYDTKTFQAVCDAAEIKPAVLQNRLYKETGYDVALRDYCTKQGIAYQSFWTLTANPHLLSSNTVRTAAKTYGLTPEQTFLRGLTQLGIIPLTGTTSLRHMKEDLALLDVALDAATVEQLRTLLQ